MVKHKLIVLYLIAIANLAYTQDLSFTIRELPVEYPGTSNILLNSLNDSGIIAGSLKIEGNNFHNYFVYEKDTVKIIPMLAGYSTIYTRSDKTFINNKNTVAGQLYASTITPANQIFLYRDGTNTGIATGESAIYDLNDFDVVAGTVQVPPYSPNAAIFINNATTNIGTLGGGRQSWAHGINNKNWVVGQSDVDPDNTNKHAFVYKNGTMIDLGILPHHVWPDFDEYSSAVAINDSGTVIGQSRRRREGVSYYTESFVWYNADPLVQLPGITGALNTFAIDINNNNIIIGRCNTSAGSVLVIWKDEIVFAIDDLVEQGSGYTITSLIDINNRNEILARADYSGEQRWVLLTPSVSDALIVNQTSDESDADLSDEICDTDLDTPGNQCTLRAAIEQANHNAGKDKIIFNIPGNPNPVLQIESPLPAITEEVEIDGIKNQ